MFGMTLEVLKIFIYVNRDKTSITLLCLSLSYSKATHHYSKRTPHIQKQRELFHCAWQFNFSGFKPKDENIRDQDTHDSSHITRLHQGGVDLDYNWHRGVPWDDLQYKQLNKGKLYWISFDGAFCFGQLIKFANGNVCPGADGFLTILGNLFPICYDVSQMMRSTNHVPTSIEDVAKLLRVRVDGEEVSLAASRSVLTCGIFN
ncbi:hypothetical protein K1719_018334 [Acacia pycnantha]|nr:hypothetical protein K1719_018334 [Acacia pycnantha]